MPTYNRSHLVANAIESVLNQTYKNVEIVLVDDGSTDNTLAVIQPFLQLNNFKYIFQENKGRSYARNQGLSHTEGEFILFLDSDDYLELDAIDVLVKLSLEYPAINIFSGGYRLYQVKNGSYFEIYKRQFYIHLKNIFIEQIQGMILNMGNNIIRKSLIQASGGFNCSLDYAEDWELLLKICRYENVVSTEKIILNIYRHSDNSSFLHIQESVISVAYNMINKLKSEGIKDNLTKKIIIELEKRLIMAYNRKNDKFRAFILLLSVLKRDIKSLITNIFLYREIVYMFISANLLITARTMQLKLISKKR
ncbi:glycosyltransferase family 2 protein [Pedobacter puniceum]|uniref:glycosyltransferase family 2 protein n=1 Tax=Pedobacter puniceum TaxID=2666136 RepID=UPI00293C09F8|nr:glycosyltransferase family 2 protein [Pedobacter puniceum]